MSALAASRPAARSRAQARAAVAPQDALRPAKGLMLGLGLSSLIWSALIALVVF